MITVNAIKESAGHYHGIGEQYERRVSTAAANRLAGMYPLPVMGSEIVVALAPERGRLYLANISGAFYVRCYTWPVQDWPQVFQVRVIDKPTPDKQTTNN
jgi:hypothetical protein